MRNEKMRIRDFEGLAYVVGNNANVLDGMVKDVKKLQKGATKLGITFAVFAAFSYLTKEAMARRLVKLEDRIKKLEKEASE